MDLVILAGGGGMQHPGTPATPDTQEYAYPVHGGETATPHVMHGAPGTSAWPSSPGALLLPRDAGLLRSGGRRGRPRNPASPDTLEYDQADCCLDRGAPPAGGDTGPGKGVKRPRSPPASARRRLRPGGSAHLQPEVAGEIPRTRGTKRKAGTVADREHQQARTEERHAGNLQEPGGANEDAYWSGSRCSIALQPVVEGDGVTWVVPEGEIGIRDSRGSSCSLYGGAAARGHERDRRPLRDEIESQGQGGSPGGPWTGPAQKAPVDASNLGLAPGLGVVTGSRPVTGANKSGAGVSRPLSPPRRGIG